MSFYYVRIKPQLNGTNAVHKEDCPFLPDIENRIYLGEFISCDEAIWRAKLHFPDVSPCYFCSSECPQTKNKIIHDWHTFLEN
ncbi:MAG TPA: hypothetical protein VMV47_05030 [Bacteroidales bacterium]|nr:hypothetical protein [Bacteroidales bacterium]